MSERKSINRYYDPNVDPSKVRFSKKQKKDNKSQSVRLMIPFSMKCLKCNEYIAQSRKFNARKETLDRDYLGIKIIKFSIRCPRCYTELIFETDPKNSNYECIQNCKKNYERAKEIKSNESIDEMIKRLDKEVEEDKRLDEIKKGNKRKMDSDETGMEQLEKRLDEQQKEKERVEELEDLQNHMNTLDSRRLGAEAKLEEQENEKLDNETRKAFESYKKSEMNKKVIKQKTDNTGLMSGYSSSSDSSDDDDGVDQGNRKVAAGVTKRRKINIKI